ncbi:MAG: amidase [Vicinamibacterales bacterium]
MQPIAVLARQLAEGRTTSRALTESALERIADPAGEGQRTFVRVFRDQALAAADAADALRRAGVAPSPLAGIPVSVKDLFDVAGVTTLAGSVVLADRPPATADATAVARLRAAGAVILGTTNMVEFAYGAHGVNPHYGTPRNPFDRATGRIPGGSSSGAAVAVADGMGAVGLGTDTAGSVRMPAALCGIVGFKPTARRVPLTGVVPLAYSLDSVGPLAPTVACCATVDAILAGAAPAGLPAMPVAGLRIAVPRTVVRDGLDDHVAACFEAALSRLSVAGARVAEIDFPELEAVRDVHLKSFWSAVESYHWHRDLLARDAARYDPSVAARLRRGADVSGADYVEATRRRAALIAAADARTAPFDAVAMPTMPEVAPPVAAFDGAPDTWPARLDSYRRNTSLGNFLDRCAVTLPCHPPGTGPVGFMLMGETMGDRRLLAIAHAVEGVSGFSATAAS